MNRRSFLGTAVAGLLSARMPAGLIPGRDSARMRVLVSDRPWPFRHIPPLVERNLRVLEKFVGAPMFDGRVIDRVEVDWAGADDLTFCDVDGPIVDLRDVVEPDGSIVWTMCTADGWRAAYEDEP